MSLWDERHITWTAVKIIQCRRCRRWVKKIEIDRDRWLEPEGWFLMEDGYRCGCVLQRQKAE